MRNKFRLMVYLNTDNELCARVDMSPDIFTALLKTLEVGYEGCEGLVEGEERDNLERVMQSLRVCQGKIDKAQELFSEPKH